MSKRRPPHDCLVLCAAADKGLGQWVQQLALEGGWRCGLAVWEPQVPGMERSELMAELEGSLRVSASAYGLLTSSSLAEGFPRPLWLRVLRDHLLGVRPALLVKIAPCDHVQLTGNLPIADLTLYPPAEQANQMHRHLRMLEIQAKRRTSRPNVLAMIPGLSQNERAAALMFVGQQFLLVGDPFQGRECLEAAAELRAQTLTPDDPVHHATQLAVADAEFQAGQRDQALERLVGIANFWMRLPPTQAVQRWAQLEKAYELAGRLGDLRLQEMILTLQEQTLDTAPALLDAGVRLARRGRLARLRDDLPAARAAFEQALAHWARDRSPDATDLPRTRNDLALLLMQQGEYAQAEALLHQALQDWEPLAGRLSEEFTGVLVNLSRCYREQGRLVEARASLESALELREQLLTPDHPLLGNTCHHLAVLYETLGEPALALEQYRRALAILSAHPSATAEAVAVRHNLALLLERTGDLNAAGALLQDACTVVRTTLGPDHPYLVTVCGQRADFLERRGKLAPALKQRQELLPLLTALHDHDPALVVREQRRIAELALRMNDTEQARQALDAMESSLAALGPEHPERLALRPVQAQIALQSGDPRAAIGMLESALTEALRNNSASDPALLPLFEPLADLLAQAGRSREAATFAERALLIREQHYGRHHPQVLPALAILCRIALAAKQRARARQHLNRAETLLADPQAAPFRAEWATLRTDVEAS